VRSKKKGSSTSTLRIALQKDCIGGGKKEKLEEITLRERKEKIHCRGRAKKAGKRSAHGRLIMDNEKRRQATPARHQLGY